MVRVTQNFNFLPTMLDDIVLLPWACILRLPLPRNWHYLAGARKPESWVLFCLLGYIDPAQPV